MNSEEADVTSKILYFGFGRSGFTNLTSKHEYFALERITNMTANIPLEGMTRRGKTAFFCQTKSSLNTLQISALTLVINIRLCSPVTVTS